MVIKKSAGEKAFDVFNYLLLFILICITIYPLLYVLFASFSDPKELLKHEGIIYWPLGKPTLLGYKMTLRSPNILRGYRNTLIYVIGGSLINLVFTSFAAFILSRKDFVPKKIMMIMIVITMFFSGGLIPMFFIVKSLSMYDTMWAILIPTAINSWNMIIMRTFFMSIPDSLEESAIIDGANDFIVFIKIIIPLSKPVIAVMCLYYGVFHWNSWFQAMIFLRDRSIMPLQLFLREILIMNNTDKMIEGGQEMLEESFTKELIKYCTIVISTLPILSIYPFLQKYFVKGVMIGALKQ